MTKEEILKPYVDGRRVQREEALFCMEAYKNQELTGLQEQYNKLAAVVASKKQHLRYDEELALRVNKPYKYPDHDMRDLGITYQDSVQSKVLETIFFNCENVPDTLPSYIFRTNVNPMEFIEKGLLSDVRAIRIADNQSNDKDSELSSLQGQYNKLKEAFEDLLEDWNKKTKFKYPVELYDWLIKAGLKEEVESEMFERKSDPNFFLDPNAGRASLTNDNP